MSWGRAPGKWAGLVAFLLLIPLAGCERREDVARTRLRVAVCGEELARAALALGVGPRIVGVDSASRALLGLGAADDLGTDCGRAADHAADLDLDVVAFARGDASAAQALEALGVQVLTLAPASLDEVLDANRRLGALFGAESRALVRNAEIARGTSDIAQRRDGKTRLRVAWVLASEVDGFQAVGGEGALHELLELAGAENAFHTPPVSRRRVTREDFAEVDLVLHGGGGAGPDVLVPVRRAPPELGRLPILDPLVRLEPLHRLIYPEAD